MENFISVVKDQFYSDIKFVFCNNFLINSIKDSLKREKTWLKIVINFRSVVKEHFSQT